jgi:hypothetical protein
MHEQKMGAAQCVFARVIHLDGMASVGASLASSHDVHVLAEYVDNFSLQSKRVYM